MLLLRAFRDDLAEDEMTGLGFGFAMRPAAMFSFPSVFAMLWGGRGGVAMMMVCTKA